MKALLFFAFIKYALLDTRCIDTICSNNSSSYFNLLANNSYLTSADKNCVNGNCIAYLLNNNCELCDNQACKDLCISKQRSNTTNIKTAYQAQVQQKQVQKKPVIVTKVVTATQEELSEPEPVTVVKTEVKTVTVDAPRLAQAENCIGECTATRSKGHKLKRKAQQVVKRQSRKRVRMSSDADSVCSSDANDAPKQAQRENSFKTQASTSTPFVVPKENNITLTQIVEKTKTVEKPITLYREITTTLSIEVPIINYKVTTVTRYGTKISRVTLTEKASAVIEQTEKDTSTNSTSAKQIAPEVIVSKSTSNIVNKSVEPATVTVFTSSTPVQAFTQSTITITKAIEAPKASSTEKCVEASCLPPLTSFTHDSVEKKTASQKVSTIFSTVSEYVSRTQASSVEVKTYTPPVSVISIITKTMTIDEPQKSIASVSTVTVTEKERTSLKRSRSSTSSQSVEECVDQSGISCVCDSALSCVEPSRKYGMKAIKRSKSFNITKAIAKGCETTMDIDLKRPRTICRFVNVAKPPKVNLAKKKRTVVKTVYADDDDDCEKTTTKTVFE